ncbi:outer membrane protein assembly factor BamB family protein [Virgisporangium aliadipatigenens]|uniref:outer membrane protein assembly factor BamB family protein n=1 Tax=Virgisporangium aliadipatigenens TaxID=741659 RepID=UPI0019412694|nr:PQQ-binding-like beta-propeller repeat protein [Virgisporangium aliadipatigenens]
MDRRWISVLIALRHAVRPTGPAFVVVGAVMTVAALLGPWSWRQGEAHGKPDVAVLLAIALLGPALSALRPAALRVGIPPLVSALVAAGGAVGAALLAARTAAGEATFDGLAPGGPICVLGCVITAVGWLIVAGTVRLTAPVTRRAYAAAGVVVLVIVLMLNGFTAWIGTRNLDARVLPAGTRSPEALPSSIATERWRATVSGTPVGTAAGLLVLRDRTGIFALDASTGTPGWHFRRSDATLSAAGLSADGTTALASWVTGTERTVAAFDAATGERLWQRIVPPGSPAPGAAPGGPASSTGPGGAANSGGGAPGGPGPAATAGPGGSAPGGSGPAATAGPGGGATGGGPGAASALVASGPSWGGAPAGGGASATGTGDLVAVGPRPGATAGNRPGDRPGTRPDGDGAATARSDSGVAVIRPARGRPLLALDLSTGLPRWEWLPGDPSCTIADLVPVADDVLATLLECPGGFRVAGLTTSGAAPAIRWTWVPPEQSTRPVLVRTDGGVLVRSGAGGVVLAAGTGTPGATHAAPPGGLVASVGARAVYVDAASSVVDLAFGRPLWTVEAPGPGQVGVALAGRDTAAYVLTRAWDNPLAARILRVDLNTGRVTEDRAVPAPTQLLYVGPGVLIAATPSPAGPTTLTALG